ncbi:MAG: polyphenol oxidase family protein [Bdellovibrionota bacterium]
MLISLKTFDKNGKVYGQYYENDQVFLFFGNKHFEKEHFSFFPSIQFQFLKQVHGNKVVHFDRYTDELHQADGHYTATKNLGLVIQTADCLPILAYDQHNKWIMGLHAGWRGVENKITKIGLEQFTKESRSPLISVYVGPHIQYKSFEVDEDVAMKLIKCTEIDHGQYIHDEDTHKYFFNLKKIVHAQMLELPIQIQELYFSNIDTMTNEEYSSFRRQKASCRNYSFIYLK